MGMKSLTRDGVKIDWWVNRPGGSSENANTSMMADESGGQRHSWTLSPMETTYDATPESVRYRLTKVDAPARVQFMTGATDEEAIEMAVDSIVEYIKKLDAYRKESLAMQTRLEAAMSRRMDVAKPVLVAMQNHDLNVWVEVETELPPEPHEFMVTGTGHGAPEYGVHVGSTLDGEYVWHLWRRT